MKRVRLDKALVTREVSRSRSQAKELIEAGEVLVNGIPTENPSSLLGPDDTVSLVNPERAEWVGRGGRKLEPLLDEDLLKVQDDVVLDVGASTGGFSQAILREGASNIIAVDAGEGQLAYELRRDDRVINHEKYNFRYADPEDFSLEPDKFVMDVSFISTEKLIPPLNLIMPPLASGLVLVKPQFEAKPSENIEGIVKDPEIIKKTLQRIIRVWKENGWFSHAIRPSPIQGSSGNQEFFIQFSRDQENGANTFDLNSIVDKALEI